MTPADRGRNPANKRILAPSGRVPQDEQYTCEEILMDGRNGVFPLTPELTCLLELRLDGHSWKQIAGQIECSPSWANMLYMKTRKAWLRWQRYISEQEAWRAVVTDAGETLPDHLTADMVPLRELDPVDGVTGAMTGEPIHAVCWRGGPPPTVARVWKEADGYAHAMTLNYEHRRFPVYFPLLEVFPLNFFPELARIWLKLFAPAYMLASEL